MPVMSLQLLSHRVRGMGPDQTMLLPLLFFSMCFFFFISLAAEELFCLSSDCSQRVTLYIVGTLVCPWEEVRSGSSYSTILMKIPDCLIF